MKFKEWLFLELADAKLEVILSGYYDPDSFYRTEGFSTFIYDQDENNLYIERAHETHRDVLDFNGLSQWEQGTGNLLHDKINLQNCIYGRVGEIKEDNLSNKLRAFAEVLPVKIIAFWPSWTSYETNTFNIDNCIKKFMYKDFNIIGRGDFYPVDNETIVIDGIRVPHYVGQNARNLHDQEYKIGTFIFTDKDIRDWMGKLHFLPSSSPERSQILHYAEIIKKSEYAHKFPDFLSRVYFKPLMKRNAWNQALQDKKLAAPGHSIFRPTSETTL